MKKFLALIISIVMIFSIAAIPSTAGVADSAQGVVDNYNAGNYGAAIDSAFSFAKDLAKAIHSLVGGILGVLDKECPFCDEIHKSKANDDADKDDCNCEGECTCGKVEEEEVTTAPDVEEPTTEESTTEESTTEESTTEESTTEESTTEESTTEESTTEESTTEESTTEESTTEESTTEESTTEESTTEESTTEESTTQPTVTYETYKVRVTNSTLASDRYYNYTSDGTYPQNVDVAFYFWNRAYKANTVTIKNTATAYVNAAVYISDESVGIDTIVFAGGNNFHGNNGVFKLIVNTTDIPVKVKLSGTNKIGSLVLTADNIGNYIVGPYTVA